MNISVLTPEREIFNGPIESVSVPGVSGAFQVLKNHAPIVSALEEGVVSIVTGEGYYSFYNAETGEMETAQETGKRLQYKVDGGFIEVLNNEVSLLITAVVE